MPENPTTPIKQLVENDVRFYPLTSANAVFFEDSSYLSSKPFATGVLTINLNGSQAGTFSASGANNQTINIQAASAANLLSLVASASYNSNTKKIEFFNTASTKLCDIDASAFIKDGMIDSVSIGNGTGANASKSCLLIDFNTDAEAGGHTDIEIPLEGIFNPANYYTKTETDNTFVTQTEFNNDARVVSAALNDLNDRVTDTEDAIDGLALGDTNVIETVKVNNTALTPDANKTVNITVPTKVSDLNNDSGFTSNTGTITGITMNGASKGTSGVVDLGTVITDVSGKENTSNKVTSISSSSTNVQYPSAKCVYDEIADAAYIGEQQGSTTYTSGGAVVDLSNYVQTSNVKTINNQSILGSGNLTITGEQGDDGVGIASVVQTTESTVSGGTNVITVTKTNGTTSTFNVRNGDAVGSATIVQTTGDSTTSVMSQDGTTKALSDAMQKVQVGTSMVFAGRTATKLSAAQVAAINAAEEITIKWVIKSPTQNMAYRYAVVLSTGYYCINYSYFQSLSVKKSLDPNSNWLGKYVNGDNTTASKNRMCSNQCLIINRVTGRVRWYENTTLCVDETSNDYKADKFINDDGLIGFYCGDMEMRHYCIQIYNYDMSWLFNVPDSNNLIAQTWREGEGKDVSSFIKGSFRNDGYQFVDTNRIYDFYTVVGGTKGGGNSPSDPYYVSFVEGTAVAGSSYAIPGPYYSKNGSWSGKCKIVRYPMTISGGVVSAPSTWHYSNNPYLAESWTKVYDSNGDLVADQTNIGAGDYTIEYLCTNGPGAPVYYVSGSPTLTARYSFSYKPICCVVNIDFGLLYDGCLVDKEADTVYPLWKANNIDTIANLQWAETNKYDAVYVLSKAPILSVYSDTVVDTQTGSIYPPSMNGDIAIKSGNIYYGDADARTWKRINNA